MSKKLAIKESTLKKLFAASGNFCSFEDCITPIVDINMNMLGEVCHISAKSKEGPRFDSKLTPEDRRSYDNLILMCSVHHTIIDSEDNQDTYNVTRLKEMKKQHEIKFLDIGNRLRNSINDHTKNSVVKESINGEKFFEFLGGYDPEADKDYLLSINNIAHIMKKIPVQTRKFFVILLERADIQNKIMSSEVKRITKMSEYEIDEEISLLVKYNLIYDNTYNSEGHSICEIKESELGFKIWEDIKKFAVSDDFDLKEIIVNLNFNLLD